MPAIDEPAFPHRPAAIDPRSITERAFALARRGFDPNDVRAHLGVVADQIRALQEYAEQLESQLRDALSTKHHRAEARELDVHEIATLVGEETARVLETAREAADQIRAKAEEKAARLVREASDEASATRSGADEYAARLRREAEEEAMATRNNADRYAAELRRATDEEVAETRARAKAEAEELRRETEEHASATRAAADEHAARVRAEADDHAASTRAAAEEELARLRSHGQAEVERLRAEAEAEAESLRGEASQVLAVRREEAEMEASRILREAEQARDRILAEADGATEAAAAEAARLVRDAEEARERVLHDLARRRKQAKAHLEQLEAARSRLLSAYDTVRSLADEATHELNVVLPEARAAASEALQRALGAPELTAEQLEAELAATHEAEPATARRAESAATYEAGPPLAAEPLGPAAPPSRFDRHGLAAGRAATPAVLDRESGAAQPLVERPEGEAGAGAAERGDEDGVPEQDATEAGGEPEHRRGGLFNRRRRERAAGQHGVIVSPPEPSPVGNAAPRTETGNGSAAIREHDGDLAGTGTSDVEAPAHPDGATAEAASGDAAAAPAGADKSVDDLFARLRASQEVQEPDTAAGGGQEQPTAATEIPPETKDVAPPEGAPSEDGAEVAVAPSEAGEPPAEVAWREHRDSLIAGFEKRLSKRLKRTLADEESEVLDHLRTVKGRPTLEAVLGDTADIEHAYVECMLPLLREAVAEGAASVADIGAGEPASGRVATDVRALAEEIASGIAELLRPRLEHAITEAASGADPVDELELADRLRACYRELRTQRLGELARHSLLAAFDRGLFDAIPDGTLLRWVVDDSRTPCPDCADNVLAGAVARGDPFPTEHLSPPAHPGCRCFLFAARL